MDLITPGNDGPLSDKEYTTLNDGCDPNKDWLFQARKSYERLHSIRGIWKYFTPDQKIKESHYMYDCIFRCKQSSKSNTEWISKDLIDQNGRIDKFTSDHPFTARIVTRIIMKDWPPFMDDFNQYAETFNSLCRTVGITKKDNQDVKVLSGDNGEIKISTLTKDKYSKFKFKNIKTGQEISGLPFEIPEWFEMGEKERLISNDEKEKNKLNKLKLVNLQELANGHGICIYKHHKKKTKRELIDEIMVVYKS